MSARQIDIARACGLDVSSVNKILNRKQGPKFKRETIKAVFKAAKDLDYPTQRLNKAKAVDYLREVFPASMTASELATLRGMPEKRVQQIKTDIYKSA